MKFFIVLMIIISAQGCGKTRRSKTQPETKASSSAYPVEQWSGRNDSIDARWQIKSQP